LSSHIVFSSIVPFRFVYLRQPCPKCKKLILGIDKIEKLVLGIKKKRHKTSFGDKGKGKPSQNKFFVLKQFHDATSGGAGKKWRVGSFCRQMNVRGGVTAVGV
jgi:hypothetical protein